MTEGEREGKRDRLLDFECKALNLLVGRCQAFIWKLHVATLAFSGPFSVKNVFRSIANAPAVPPPSVHWTASVTCLRQKCLDFGFSEINENAIMSTGNYTAQGTYSKPSSLLFSWFPFMFRPKQRTGEMCVNCTRTRSWASHKIDEIKGDHRASLLAISGNETLIDVMWNGKRKLEIYIRFVERRLNKFSSGK